MANQTYLATLLVVVAIATAFYAGSIGFGFQEQAALPSGQFSLFQECDLTVYIEEWKDGEIDLDSLLDKIDSWQEGRAC